METPPPPDNPGVGFVSLEVLMFMFLCSVICVQAWLYFLVRLLEDFAHSLCDVVRAYSGLRREMRETVRGEALGGGIPLCRCQRPAVAVLDDPPPRYPGQPHGEDQHRRYHHEIRAEREAERAGYMYQEARRMWRRERDRRQVRRVLRDLLGYPRVARRREGDGSLSVSGRSSNSESSSGWDLDSSGGSEEVVIRGRPRHRSPRQSCIIHISQQPENVPEGPAQPNSQASSPSVVGQPDALGIDNRELDQHANQPPSPIDQHANRPPSPAASSDSESDPWDPPPPPAPSPSLISNILPNHHPENPNHATPEDNGRGPLEDNAHFNLQLAHVNLASRHRLVVRRFREHLIACHHRRERHNSLVRRHQVLVDELNARNNPSHDRAHRRRDNATDHGNRGRDPRSAEPPVWRPRRVRSEDVVADYQLGQEGVQVNGDAGPALPQIHVSPAPGPSLCQHGDRVPISRTVLSAVEGLRLPRRTHAIDRTSQTSGIRGTMIRPCQTRSPSPSPLDLGLGLAEWIRRESELANDIDFVIPPPPPSESDSSDNDDEAKCSCQGHAEAQQRQGVNESGSGRAEAVEAAPAARPSQRRFPLVNRAPVRGGLGYLILN